MKKMLFAAIAGAIAAIAFWRRKTFKDDSARVTQAGKGAVGKATQMGKGAAAKVNDRVRGRSATDAANEELSSVDTLDLRNDGESVPQVPSTAP